MPIPILPAGALFQKRVQKGVIEEQQRKQNTEYQGAYFDGLKGLSSEGREAWEKQYLNEISGRSDAEKDEIFRNTVFKSMFENSDRPEDQEVWNNRGSLSLADRDIFFARKAVEEDLDQQSDAKESPLSLMETMLEPEKTVGKVYAKTGKTLREAATDYLSGVSQDVADAYKQQVANMDTADKDQLVTNFDQMSREAIPLYKEYIGTDKLQLDRDQMAELAANYTAWQNVGGDNFAYRMLHRTYQDMIAKNQSIWEKTVNTGAQFVDSGAGMIIRAAGMVGGLTGIGLDEDENYWDHLLDNSVTRYGDRVATTQSWSTARQKYLEENGMQDNPILGTEAQQNSLVSWNTPFEVLGQYGFTAASTILSFGGSAAVEGLTNTAGWVAKASAGAKGLNTTAKGVRLAKNLIRAKDIGNLLVVGGIGAVEGGMNAVQTRDKTLKDLNADIDKDFNQAIDSNINDYVANNTSEAISMLVSAGKISPNDAEKVLANPNLEQISMALRGDEGVRELFGNQISGEYADRRAAAEKSAHDAMMVDFVGNSIINGFVNATFQATLNAPSVQRSLRKYGLQKSPLDDLGVVIKNEDNAWRAAAKKFTKWDGVKNRFKEAWGEGVEEYTQDISGAFGEGFGKDRMSQYLQYKYGDADGSDAFEDDVFRNFLTGLQYAGEAAVSPESIKDGLYGILSTAVGGPNVNIGGRGSRERQADESQAAYLKRRSPIVWRSAFGPLFNNETDEVNKQRDETAQRINDFFANQENQNLFFDLEASTNWMREARRATLSGDEKALRDAQVGQMVSNIFAANELQGSAYYDAITTSLKSRANFNLNNLANPESAESKAADQYVAATQNRGEDITREEALNEIKKSATDMLSLMESVGKETASVEKLFGSGIDRDTKEALVYQRISSNDAKNRMDQIDKEIEPIKSAIDSQDDIEPSTLGRRSRRLIARFGTLGNAVKSYDKMVEEKKKLDDEIAEFEEEIKSDISVNRGVETDRKSRREARGKISAEREVLNTLKEQSKEFGRTIDSAKKDLDRYRREASRSVETTIDAEGNEVTSEKLVGNEVLSAREIMNLDAVDRAYMLDPKNRNKYSAEQQAEIQKVEVAGKAQMDDFTSKIVDRGRLESDYNGMLRTMLKMTQSPETFARYQQAVKEGKQRRLLNKKYDYLRDYDSNKTYAEFAQELSRIFNEAPVEEKKAATRVLNSANSAYYARYKEANDIRKNIYGRLVNNEAFNKLSDNDKNLLSNTIDYLVDKGVDLDDNNAIVEALNAAEEDPNNPGTFINSFGKYVEGVNSQVNDNEKAVMSSPGQAIQNFKDVMSSIRKEEQEQQSNSRPVEVTPTPAAQSAPAKAPQPNPAPGIFGNGAYSSPDQGRPEGSDEATSTPVGNPVDQNPPKSPQSGGGNAVIETFRHSSGDTVAKAAETALNAAENTPSHVADSKAIEAAKSKINGLKDNFFESVDDFVTAIMKEATELDGTGESANQATAAVLRRAASTAENQAKIQSKPTQQQPASPLIGLAARRYNYVNQVNSLINPNSATIATLNIQSIKQRHPDSSLAKFLDKYKVEEFLSDPEALTGERRVIRFMVDSQLALDTQQSMESAGRTYTVADIPVVPVVEVKQRSDHVLVVNENGTEHYYQPIGILPATYNTYTSGANRLGKLRELANAQEQNQLIKDENGNVISTTVTGHVTATPPQHLMENSSVLHVGMSSLNDTEKSDLKGKTKDEARKTPAYQRLKDKFLSHFGLRTNKYGVPEMYYTTSNLKNDGNSSGFLITRTPVHKSVDMHSSKPIVDLFKENAVDQALAANSRIRRYAADLQKFFAENQLGGSLFIPDGSGGYTISDAGQKLLDQTVEKLGSKLGNYFILPNKLDGGPVKYRLTPTYQNDQDGNPIFTLSVANDAFEIPLTTVSTGKVTEQNAFEALKNLILDEKGNPRMRSDKESFVVYQIPYADIKDMGSNSRAKDNISDIYDDGILEASVSSFDYTVTGVQFNAPFSVEGTPLYPTKTVANGDNATSPNAGTTITTNGKPVDPVSGAKVGETVQSGEKPVSPAAATAGQIIENSQHIRLSDDGTVYIDDRTGTRYARVTSIISADKEGTGEHFDPNNPWGLPSTNIGTGIDELVRDFFGDNLKDFDSYPNTTKEQVERFVEQLKGLKNELAASGLTVIPRDVVVTGTLNATDANGNVHPINVAGTLDLLAYDGEGNFYIFDMKTFRTSINAEKQKKYARQLSLYKKFLEDAYGVQVKSLKIIPIKVDYPAPSAQAKYEVKEGVANQLTVNGKDYTGAKPNLHQTIPLEYKEPEIDFEKLTAEEKAMFQETIEAQTGTTAAGVQSVTPAPPTAAPVDPLTNMPMVGYENPLLGNNPAPMAGQSSTFVVSDLRWGEWTGLNQDQKNTLRVELVRLGYNAEDWESNDPEIRPSDTEKEHAIKCIMGL